MSKKMLSIIYSNTVDVFSLQPILLWLAWSFILSFPLQLAYTFHSILSSCGTAWKLQQYCETSKNILLWPADIIYNYTMLYQLFWVVVAFFILGLVRYFNQKDFRKNWL